MKPLYENAKIERLMSSVAAGTATNYSDVLDTKGFDSVSFLAMIGAVDPTGTVTMKIQQGDASNLDDAADLAGASVALTAADDEKMLFVEIYRPQKRYLRAVVTTAVADGEIDGVIAILRDPQVIPISWSTDVADKVILASPEEVE